MSNIDDLAVTMTRKTLIIVVVMAYIGFSLSWLYFTVLTPPIDCLDVVDGKLRHYAVYCLSVDNEDESTYAVGCKWIASQGCNITNIPNKTKDDSCISYNIVSVERGVYLSSECLMEDVPDKDTINIFMGGTDYIFSALEAEQKDAVRVYFKNGYSNQSET